MKRVFALLVLVGFLSLTVSFIAPPSASAGTAPTIISPATYPPFGANPYSPLVIDSAGNLYGTATTGGRHNFGTVFRLTPAADKWVATVLYSFKGGEDGDLPYGGVILDGAGNLYGTTTSGGKPPCSCGTVFELTPSTTGAWTKTVLHRFSGGGDGGTPAAALVFDSEGNLYGTTLNGGAFNEGTVLKLTPSSTGKWTEKILHNFGSGVNDGVNPQGSLAIDSSGNLYGTTTTGVYNAGGVAFKLSPDSIGGWKETILHPFGASGDGKGPYGGLILDSAGNLYGTTISGGKKENAGTVFELTPSSGVWTETVLHSFTAGTDGKSPYGNVVLDSAGSLYGTTAYGGSAGTVFKVAQSSGVWREAVIVNFGNQTGDNPNAGLVFDTAGNLYGTTVDGGMNGFGTVFELTVSRGRWTQKTILNF